MSHTPTLDKLVAVSPRFARSISLKLRELFPFVAAAGPDVKNAVKEARWLVTQRDRAYHDFVAAIKLRE
jgi:hypothetical protein